MTDGERIAVAVMVSFVVHWAALSGWQREAGSAAIPTDDVLFVDADVVGPDVGISLAVPIVLEQAQTAVSSDEAVADRRREALNHYLDKVSEAIHTRRRSGGEGKQLIGNTIFRFTIDGKGRFSGIILLRSSGDTKLDADAEAAVRAASGVVPRPKILGFEALIISLAVKYQFGL